MVGFFKIKFVFILFYCFVHFLIAQNQVVLPEFKLLPGDLLFQDLDCGPLCNAIESVTKGYNNYNFSHVGIVMEAKNDNAVIVEAYGEKVIMSQFLDFIIRSRDSTGKPKVVVGRLKPEYQHLVPFAVLYAKAKIDKNYDSFFNITNDSYYCSELIYEVFRESNNYTPLFDLQPMDYNDPATNQIAPAWKEYFEKLKAKIPQDKLGINPGGISLSPLIEIVYKYGEPSKKK